MLLGGGNINTDLRWQARVRVRRKEPASWNSEAGTILSGA